MDLLRLRNRMRVMMETEDGGGGGPVVVHCSAGVGRTGTLIGLDNIARQIETAGATEVNVFNAVYEMRENRCKMVQQPVQYAYLYQCVAAFIEEWNAKNAVAGGGRDGTYVDEDGAYVYSINVEKEDDAAPSKPKHFKATGH